MTVTINGSTGIDKVQDGTIQSADFAAGVPARSNLPAGTVLQVVSATTNTSTYTSSSSYVASSLAASITPTSATNKIYISVSVPVDTDAANQQTGVTIYRNSTNLGTGLGTNSFNLSYSTGGRIICSVAMSYLDSPTTTSATTYTVYFASFNGGTVAVNDAGAGTITLMEIAA